MMQDLLNELRANTRLRLGIWLIVFILLLYGVLRLNDYQKNLSKQYETARQQLYKLETVASETHWQKRQTEAEKLKIDLETQLWQASSQGLARADFQSWLSIAVRRVKLVKTRMKVEDIEVLDGKPTLWKVSARIDGTFQAEPLTALLRDIANNKEVIVVDHLDIPARGSKRFSLQVSAYFQAHS